MSSAGKEVITVQLGSFPNFVGAHYFNIQNAGFSFNPDFPSEINHDVLFREGQSSSASFTYTPRLVSVDFEGSLSTLSKSGTNFVAAPSAEEVKAVAHVENLEVCQAPPLPKNDYLEDVEKQVKAQDNPAAMSVDLVLKTKYDLNTVQSWPELLTMNLHPRSITPIPKTLTNGLELPKTTYKIGAEIWKNPAFADDFEDSLRFQLEACDTVQGFQLLTECENMYSGLSNGCLDYLRDECPKTSILTVPIFGLFCNDGDGLENRKQMCSNLINTAYCFSRSHELSDLVSPFSTLSELWTEGLDFRDFHNLNLHGPSIYHSSAVMASALELVTSPYRLKRLPETKLSHIVALHGLPGRRFVGAGLVLPFPEAKPELDILAILKAHKYASLCPFVSLEDTLDSQTVTLRGFPPSAFPSSPALFVSQSTLRIPRTFPDVVPQEFDLAKSALYYGRLREVRALAGLCNSREIKSLFDHLVTKMRSLNINKMPTSISTDLEKPELDETNETIMEISTNYDISSFL